MKLVYIENIRFPSERAHSYQIAMTCEALARLGVDVTLVVPDRQTSTVGTFPFVVQRLPVTDFLARAPGWLKTPAYWLERWTFQRAVRRWSEGIQADVWYTRDPWMVSSFAKPGRKIVLELHDASGKKMERLKELRPSISKYVVLTSGLREVLISAGVPSDAILVAPDAFDPRDFAHPGDRKTVRQAWGVPSDAQVALYTGSFYPWKGVDFVVDQWSMTDDRLHLVLIGGPKGDADRLACLIQSKNIKRVHLLPAMSHADVVKQFAGADIGLLPTSPNYPLGSSYTSPLKLFEYLAAGLPILASDVPSSREILNEEVARFCQPTRESFMAALTESLESTWNQSAREKARVLVQPHTWEARTKRILEFL